MPKWWIEVERVPLQRAFRLWLTYHDGEHRRILVAAHEILSTEPDQIIDQATAVIPEDAAQQLIDELWRVGLRPSEGTGSAETLAAIQKCLDDMQSKLFIGHESVMGMCKTIRSARRGRIW